MEVRMRTALPVTMVAVMLVAGVGPALAAGTASIDAPAVDHDTASTSTTDGILVNETGPPEHAGSGNETGPPDDAGPPDDGDDEEDDTDSDSSDDDQDNGNGSDGNNGNG
jgi:hypothetical protein